MSLPITLVFQRRQPTIELVFAAQPTVTAELVAAVAGAPGPKGESGDAFAELAVDPTLIFENALV